VFIDETCATTTMTRRSGWGPTRTRLVGAVPHGHWKVTTFVAALRGGGLTAPMTVDGALNGELFLAYVEQILVPSLRPGDLVVMDNLPCHKVAGVAQAIGQAQAQVVYLPPYSPDFNPIGLRQAEGGTPQTRGTECRALVGCPRRIARLVLAAGVPQLLPTLQLHATVKMKRL